tara:strand:- start:22 stop:267 length:246 start_codon:yes stop_codon:yes gene_type:complete
MADENIIHLSDLIESKLKKEQEIEYYIETMKRLQKRVNELEKEINLTSLIIQMIEQERVLTIDEKRSKIIHVLDAKKDDLG